VIAVVAGVIILAAGGGLAAWKFLVHHPAHNPRPGGGGSVGALSGSGKNAAPSQSPAEATPTSSPSATPPGPNAVSIAPGVSQQADAAPVASFAHTYFSAINHHNYALYISLLQPRLRPTAGQFYSGYRGTHDSHATLTGLSPTANGLAATVTFTSHQPASNSPTHTGCTKWTIALYLLSRGGSYRITSPPPGYHAQYEACR
jgi:hypothetical protein